MSMTESRRKQPTRVRRVQRTYLCGPVLGPWPRAEHHAERHARCDFDEGNEQEGAQRSVVGSTTSSKHPADGCAPSSDSEWSSLNIPTRSMNIRINAAISCDSSPRLFFPSSSLSSSMRLPPTDCADISFVYAMEICWNFSLALGLVH